MEDLISRQAAIAEAYDVVIDGSVIKVVQVETLYGLPTIDPAENGGCWGCCCEKLGQVEKVKYGTWLRYPGDSVSDDGLWGETLYDCSVCGHTIHVPTEYCAKCGAKMLRDRFIRVRCKAE